MRAPFFIAFSALMLSGCVTAIKEREVESALSGVGFTREDVVCLSSRAARQLTVRQLRQLQAAAAAMDQPVREMPVGEAVERLKTYVEPETLRRVAGLTMECLRLRAEGKSA